MSDLEDALKAKIQAIEAGNAMADFLSSYRKRLVDNGIPEHLADQLVVNMQTHGMALVGSAAEKHKKAE